MSLMLCIFILWSLGEVDDMMLLSSHFISQILNILVLLLLLPLLLLLLLLLLLILPLWLVALLLLLQLLVLLLQLSWRNWVHSILQVPLLTQYILTEGLLYESPRARYLEDIRKSRFLSLPLGNCWDGEQRQTTQSVLNCNKIKRVDGWLHYVGNSDGFGFTHRAIGLI